MNREFKKAALIMSKRRLMRNEVKEIIDLVQENAEYKRAMGDLLLLLANINDEKYYTSLKHKDETISYIFNQIYELARENKKLKENQK
jgi:hypothetical protein